MLAKVWRPNFEKGQGKVVVVVPDLNGHILHVTDATEAQWRETLETAHGAYGSRMYKQMVAGMFIDCDGDALLCPVSKGDNDMWVVDKRPDFENAPNGLVPVAVQDHVTPHEVLMLAYTDAAGWEESQRTKIATYYSRSRGGRWVKGETSNNKQKVHDVLANSAGNALIYCVEPLGHKVACHLNARSCFFRPIVVKDPPFIMDVPEKLGPKDVLQEVELPMHQNFL